MFGLDEQLGRSRHAMESPPETAKDASQTQQDEKSTTLPSAEQPIHENAQADLLKSSGGDPFTQECD